MRRRKVLALVGGALAFAPSYGVKAQQRRRIVYLAPTRTQHLIDAFQKGLRDLGYVEGQNITTHYHFALPGGNLTGVSLYAAELNEKRLEVFQEAFPHVRRVGALWNGNNFANVLYWDALRLAAERLRIDTRPFMTKGVSDLEARFADLTAQALDGLIVITDAEFDAGREQIVRL